MRATEEQIYEVLKRYWGYDDFRSIQKDVILSVLSGRDTLALMPTGGGKSLTYQVPTLAQKGLCIVVTPLVALMKDQVDRLRSLRINAVAVHAGMSHQQIDIALDNCVYGSVRFLYVSPERLSTEIFRTRVERMPVTLIAVDEAHCISQWGYDFRPSYLRIAELRERMPDVPVLALTASATEVVQQDIMKNLHFAEPHLLRGSFARPNLSYCVRDCEDRYEQLMRLLNGVAGSGIVYVRQRETAEKLAANLQQEGIAAACYHAGMPYTERNHNQQQWLSGAIRVMVATNAFGMGIDKPDVRFVVHYAICDSLEHYYQEAGRAGRDGKRAYALLLTQGDDAERFGNRFEQEFPPLERIKELYDRLCSYLQVAIGDGYDTTYPFNIYEFCAREHLYEGAVRYGIKLLQLNDYLSLIDPRENPARILFAVDRDALYRIRVVHDDIDQLVRTLLRLYAGIFTDFQAIDIGQIATWSGYTEERVKELLRRLWQMRLIKYIPANHTPMIYLHQARLPKQDLYIAPATYLQRKELTRSRFQSMLSYALNSEECRSVILNRYFGGKECEPCGICDICLERRRAAKRATPSHQTEEQEADQALVDIIAEGPIDPHTLTHRLAASPNEIAEQVRRLLAKGVICYDRDGNLKIQ